MKRLPQEFKKNSYQYEQVWRDADYAIYKQSSEGKVVSHEVYRIQKKKEAMVFDNLVEAHEAFPSTEQWGLHGFTVADIITAHDKVDWMKKRAAEWADH